MSKQSDYQAPLVQPEKSVKKVWKRLKGDFEVLIHGLIPHERAKSPGKDFDKSHIASDDDYLYQTAFEIYKESLERISGLEEKGFKLLTYISAVSAILVYFLSSEITGMFKFFVITSLFFLVIAIIISLRCIGVKSQRAIFINTLFVFEDEAEPITKDRKTVIAEILKCAIFNQNVADNTADILKASRMMLSFGIVTTIISCMFFLANTGSRSDKIYQANVTLADSIIVRSLAERNIVQDTLIDNLSKKIILLEKHIESLNDSQPK
ncbi:hypothetical protein [Olivibacter jilunii]|uniref:hypothetical protein n=1 Tax=Olivibacter jilunii TaxID=985016 RepID=UPI003F1442C1